MHNYIEKLGQSLRYSYRIEIKKAIMPLQTMVSNLIN